MAQHLYSRESATLPSAEPLITFSPPKKIRLSQYSTSHISFPPLSLEQSPYADNCIFRAGFGYRVWRGAGDRFYGENEQVARAKYGAIGFLPRGIGPVHAYAKGKTGNCFEVFGGFGGFVAMLEGTGTENNGFAKNMLYALVA